MSSRKRNKSFKREFAQQILDAGCTNDLARHLIPGLELMRDQLKVLDPDFRQHLLMLLKEAYKTPDKARGMCAILAQSLI